MTMSVTDGGSDTLLNGGSYSANIGSLPGVIIVVAHCKTWDEITGVTVGGNAMTKVHQAFYSGWNGYVQFWWYNNSSLTGSVTVGMTSQGDHGVLTTLGLQCVGTPEIVDTFAHGGAATASVDYLDSGAVEAIRIIGSTDRNSVSAVTSGFTDADRGWDSISGDWNWACSYDTVQRSGNIYSGYPGATGQMFGAFGGICITDNTFNAEPAAIGVEVTMPAPTITSPIDIVAYPEQFGIKVTMPRPKMGVRAPMVVPLVGEHTEARGRIPRPAGFTNPILTDDGAGGYHWVEFDSLVTQRTRLVPLTTINASGDPELVWDDNGDLIYTEYYE